MADSSDEEINQIMLPSDEEMDQIMLQLRQQGMTIDDAVKYDGMPPQYAARLKNRGKGGIGIGGGGIAIGDTLKSIHSKFTEDPTTALAVFIAVYSVLSIFMGYFIANFEQGISVDSADTANISDATNMSEITNITLSAPRDERWWWTSNTSHYFIQPDLFTEVMIPGKMMPWWMLPVVSGITGIVQFKIMGFDLAFKKKDRTKFGWVKDACIKGAFLGLALNGWKVDIVRAYTAYNQSDVTLMKCLLVIATWLQSSNFLKAQAFWSSMRIQSPVQVFQKHIEPHYKSCLFGYPLLPFTTFWLHPVKWLYGVLLLPYMLPIMLIQVLIPSLLVIFVVVFGTIAGVLLFILGRILTKSLELFAKCMEKCALPCLSESTLLMGKCMGKCMEPSNKGPGCLQRCLTGCVQRIWDLLSIPGECLVTILQVVFAALRTCLGGQLHCLWQMGANIWYLLTIYGDCLWTILRDVVIALGNCILSCLHCTGCSGLVVACTKHLIPCLSGLVVACTKHLIPCLSKCGSCFFKCGTCFFNYVAQCAQCAYQVLAYFGTFFALVGTGLLQVVMKLWEKIGVIMKVALSNLVWWFFFPGSFELCWNFFFSLVGVIATMSFSTWTRNCLFYWSTFLLNLQYTMPWVQLASLQLWASTLPYFATFLYGKALGATLEKFLTVVKTKAKAFHSPPYYFPDDPLGGSKENWKPLWNSDEKGWKPFIKAALEQWGFNMPHPIEISDDVEAKLLAMDDKYQTDFSRKREYQYQQPLLDEGDSENPPAASKTPPAEKKGCASSCTSLCKSQPDADAERKQKVDAENEQMFQGVKMLIVFKTLKQQARITVYQILLLCLLRLIMLMSSEFTQFDVVSKMMLTLKERNLWQYRQTLFFQWLQAKTVLQSHSNMTLHGFSIHDTVTLFTTFVDRIWAVI